MIMVKVIAVVGNLRLVVNGGVGREMLASDGWVDSVMLCGVIRV